jgi:hypothetical protein
MTCDLQWHSSRLKCRRQFHHSPRCIHWTSNTWEHLVQAALDPCHEGTASLLWSSGPYVHIHDVICGKFQRPVTHAPS